MIAVLWLMVAISAIMLENSIRSRTRRLRAANALEGTRARWAAEAGLNDARARLALRLVKARRFGEDINVERRLDPWHGVDTLFSAIKTMGRARYQVTLRDAGSALHLNRATSRDLRLFFIALGADYGRADVISQSIVDWRDRDDLRRPRGAECAEYLRLGSAELPRNGRFHRIGEIQWVRGMTKSLNSRAGEHLTVVGSGRINLNTASRPVLLTLPGMTEEAVAVLLRIRHTGRTITALSQLAVELPPRARERFDAALPQLVRRVRLNTREVVVVVDGWTSGSPVHSRLEALLIRSGHRVRIAWRRIG